MGSETFSCAVTGKHRFEARYSSRYPAGAPKPEFTAFGNVTIPYEQIYECDICVQCGKKVTHDPH